jgi:hypothetical protein
MARTQIKRKYGEYSNIRVNEKAPIRNKVVQFVGKRFVTEEEMKNFLSKMNEESGKTFDDKKWFGRNQRYFEKFENRGQKVLTLSKYGKRVLEMIKKSEAKVNLNESTNIGLFKSEIFESTKPEVVYSFEWSEEEIAETEVAMNEGKLSNLGSKIGLYLGDMDFDKEYEELHAEFEKVLGASKDNICFVDSETNGDDPMQAKIYNYLEAHFVAKDAVESPKFKNTNHGSFQMYDPKLNVIRLDDYGFVAFYYTTDSKF